MADNLDGFFSPFLRRQRLQAALPHISGAVLDFGCGIGLLCPHVDVTGYVGVDISGMALAEARRHHPTARFMTPDGIGDLGEQKFDTVAALAVVEHLPDPASFLATMRDLLRPGGKIVLTTPNPALDWIHGLGGQIGLFARESHDEHQSLMDRNGITQAAAAAGLHMIQYRRFLFGANQLAVLSA